MKKTLLTFSSCMLIGTMLFLYTGCKKDDEVTQADLIGKWTIQSATLDANIGGKSILEYFVDELGLSEEDAKPYSDLFNNALQQSFAGTVEIKSNNTYVATLGGDANDGTWSLSSDGKKLTLDGGTIDESVIDVVSLEKNTLKLKFSESEMEDLDGDDNPETISISVDMTLTK